MPIDHRRGSNTSFVLARVLGLAERLAVPDGVDCSRALSDPFRRWDRCHRLGHRHVRLCNSGWDHGAGWYLDAGVHASAESLLARRPALNEVQLVREYSASGNSLLVDILKTIPASDFGHFRTRALFGRRAISTPSLPSQPLQLRQLLRYAICHLAVSGCDRRLVRSKAPCWRKWRSRYACAKSRTISSTPSARQIESQHRMLDFT